MIPLTSQEVAGALGLAAFEGQVARVCTDTRLLQPDDLFLALRGESYDGNAFVPAALVSGAMAIVVEEGATIVGDAEWVRQVGGNRIYWVSDSVWALGALARAVRRKSKAMVLSITGSVGKTGTKDLLTAMSAQCGETVSTSGNENNEIGVPKTLFRLLPSTRFAVVEMGMRGEGQIKELMAVAEPDVAVVTAVAPVHLELLGDMAAVARAKAEALYCLPEAGVGVIPAGQDLLEHHAQNCGHRIVRFAVCDGLGADVVVKRLKKSKDKNSSRIRITWPGGELETDVPFSSSTRIHNTAAAAAACLGAGLQMDVCLEGLKGVEFTPLRGDESQVGGVLIIDDSYNASPASMEAALGDLVERAGERGGRAVAVLGDMLELGPESEWYHHEAGQYARRAGVEILWSAGDYSEPMLEGFGSETEPGVDSSAGEHSGVHAHTMDMADPETGLKELLSILAPGDVVLVKASRGMKLERAARRIRELLETRGE